MKWGQLENPSSHWTIGLTSQWFSGLLLLITAFHFLLSAYFPPAEDELYYWAWAQNLQWSYYDHPPLVAYLIRISTFVFGDNLFGIRFFACVFSTVTILLMAFLCEKKQILGYVLFTPLFLLASILMTPDIPLVLFWMAYAVWIASINETLSQWNDDPITRVYRQMPVSLPRWFVGGVLLGLGSLGKYSMLLAVPSAAMALLSKYRGKAWVSGFIFHLAIALIIFSPVLIFNIRHDFSPFRFQWTHAMGGFHFSFHGFLDFLGTQILLVSALPLLLLPSILIKSPQLCETPKLQICFFFFVVPFLFFLLQATKSHLEANWPILSYLTFWPLAQRWNDRNSFHGIRRTILFISFIFPLACSFLALIHCVSPFSLVKPSQDRVWKLKAQYQMSRDIAKEIRQLAPRDPVFVPGYQWVSYLRFQKIPAEQLYPEGRQSQFTLEPKDACKEKSVVSVIDPTKTLPSLNCFPSREMLKAFPFVVRGKTIGEFQLVRYFR